MDLSTIGPYHVIKKLGAGGMGEVYLAEDTRLERKVALKRLSGPELDSPESRELLRREARAAAVLNHPNIAVVHDVIELENHSFIVMEYVEGRNLRDCMLEGSLSPQEVVNIGHQIAGALTEAHSHGVIHRDLKPANILLTSTGKAKVLDFGLAKRLPASGLSAATTPGKVVGTPAYMAPEQLLGHRADERTDIYGLGIVLFELSTGRWPFAGRGDQALTLKSLKKNVPRAGELEPEVPEALSDVIAKAMSWDPEKRQQSAEELGSELDQISLFEEHPTMSRRIASFARPGRRKLVDAKIALAIATSLLLVLVAAWFFLGGGRSPGDDRPVVVVVPLRNVSGDPAMDHVGVGIAHTLITKLSAVPSVTTISPTTLNEYGAESHGARDLARDLGATFVVNGSVQRTQDLLHITVNLVRADDSVAWGGEFEGSVDDLFELQRRLASGLAAGLHLNLTPTEARDLEAPSTSSAEAYAEFSQGRSFLERTHDPENMERAIHLFESAIERDPRFVLAHAALAEAYWLKFERTADSVWTERARASAEEARRLSPNHPAVRFSLAMIYHKTGGRDQAIEELYQALALQPKYDDAYALLGGILAEDGRVEEGVEELRKAIEIRPTFWGHYRDLGMIYYRAGRLHEAAEAFERITELQPDLPNGFQMLGVAYHVLGELDRAVPNYQKAVELGHGWGAHSNLGLIYYRQGKMEEAAEQYERSLELNPNHHVTYRNLGDVYQKLNRDEDAHMAYRKAADLSRKRLDVNPNDARTMGFLALCEAKLGHTNEAARLAAAAVELAPESGEVLHRSAAVHALTGDTAVAMDALESAIRHGFSASEAREDDDLITLQALPEFKKLVGESP